MKQQDPAERTQPRQNRIRLVARGQARLERGQERQRGRVAGSGPQGGPAGGVGGGPLGLVARQVQLELERRQGGRVTEQGGICRAEARFKSAPWQDARVFRGGRRASRYSRWTSTTNAK